MVNILGTLLSQLCTQLEFFPKDLLGAYRSSVEYNQGLPPDSRMISEIIQKLSEKRQVYLFVDAIDESEECKPLAQQLLHLINSTSTVNLLIASRSDSRVLNIFNEYRRISLEHHTQEINEDILRYITDNLNTDPDLGWLSSDLRRHVSDSLLSKSMGM